METALIAMRTRSSFMGSLAQLRPKRCLARLGGPTQSCGIAPVRPKGYADEPGQLIVTMAVHSNKAGRQRGLWLEADVTTLSSGAHTSVEASCPMPRLRAALCRDQELQMQKPSGARDWRRCRFGGRRS